MKRTTVQKLASKLDFDLLRVVRRLEAELTDAPGPERCAWANAQLALRTARGHVRSMMTDDDRSASA